MPEVSSSPNLHGPQHYQGPFSCFPLYTSYGSATRLEKIPHLQPWKNPSTFGNREAKPQSSNSGPAVSSLAPDSTSRPRQETEREIPLGLGHWGHGLLAV